jgi:hypothetical protein
LCCGRWRWWNCRSAPRSIRLREKNEAAGTWQA